MPDDQPSTDDRRDTGPSHDELRRRLLAIFGGAGVTLLAGCASSADLGSPAGSSSDDGSDSSDGGAGAAAADTGTFRLLISDQPVAIDEFDSLSVSFDRARLFRSGGEDADAEAAAAEASPAASPAPTATDAPTDTPTHTTTEPPTPTSTDTVTAESNETQTDVPTEVTSTETEEDDEPDDEQQGFTVIDLDGATVDLTEVIGARATGVFDGDLPAGRYTKIELYASDVVGLVDGEEVDVMVPSGKLMITKPFEVESGATLEFVFDITVVKKGPNGYNLLPVIGESGVAGEDVPVEEVGSTSKPEQAADDGEEDGADGEEEEPDEETEGSDDDAGTSGQGTGADGDQGNDPSGGSG